MFILQAEDNEVNIARLFAHILRVLRRARLLADSRHVLLRLDILDYEASDHGKTLFRHFV